MTVAFQGEIGAFSEEAVNALLPDAEPVPKPSFEAVFEAVTSGTVAYALIPIENSLHGSVHINYDLMEAHALWIAGEVHLRIRHHLMALEGATLDGLREIHSHPQALGQCRDYLHTHLAHVRLVPAYDTAGSAKMVAEMGDVHLAAIAAEQAAAEYGLEILAAGIESNHQNYTRFLLLTRAPDDIPPGLADGPSKTSIVYSLRNNVPGGLFKSLAVFALRDLDLFKIESRPLIGSPGNYLFYLDLAGAHTDDAVQRALDHLAEISASLKVLGSYPRGQTVD